ncbi:MAG: hypothetical protein GX608_11940 [Lentisphaerae bacterium]|nr:hypothetical protein [Lentisphaerota bacterium]
MKRLFLRWMRTGLFLAGTSALGLLGGCESDSDTSGSEAYFAANPYVSEEREEPDPTGLKISPANAVINVVGQQVVFTGSGGEGTYSWSVTDTSVGTVHSLTTVQCFYLCKKPGDNTVMLTDKAGHWAAAQISSSNVTVSLTITPSSAEVTDASPYASFAVSGGTAPYSWTVANASMGSISYSASSSQLASYTMFAGRYGQNTLSVTDSDGHSASATITQSAP